MRRSVQDLDKMTVESLHSHAQRAGKRMMVIGSIFFTLGVVMTVLSFTSPSPGGRFAWIVVAVGLYRFLLGLYFFKNPRKYLARVFPAHKPST
jgi:hypothetical protein